MLITSNNQNYWRIGIPYFKEYYMVFDMENSLIKIFKVIDEDDDSGFKTLYIVGIIVVSVIIIVPICFYMMLSKIKGVANIPNNYQKLA